MTDPLDLVELLRKIGICAARDAIEAWLTHTAKSKASPAQVLEQLCKLERREREARNLARRMKMATIGSPKSLDRFDWNHPRSIDRDLYEQLHSSLDFIRKGENVLLRGQAGVGKTTLAQNLGLRALERGFTVRFCTLPAALADLLKQESIPAIEIEDLAAAQIEEVALAKYRAAADSGSKHRASELQSTAPKRHLPLL